MQVKLVQRNIGGKRRFLAISVNGDVMRTMPTNGWLTEAAAKKWADKNGHSIVTVERMKDSVDSIRAKYACDVSLVKLRDREKIAKYSTLANQKKAIERMRGDTSLTNVAVAAIDSIKILNECKSKIVDAKNALLKGGYAGSANSVLKLLKDIDREIKVIGKEKELRLKQVKGTGWSTAGYVNNTKGAK